MKTYELNNKDLKLLGFCFYPRHTVSEISRHLGITAKNVSVRLPHLESANLIKVERIKGKNKSITKTYVQTIKGDKMKKCFIDILQSIEEKGFVKKEDLASVLPAYAYNSNLEEDPEIIHAFNQLPFIEPKLIETYYKVTTWGKSLLNHERIKK